VQCRVDAIAEQIGQLAAGGPILIMIGHVIALSNQVAGWQPEQSVPFAA
jgi:hypothetical protein